MNFLRTLFFVTMMLLCASFVLTCVDDIFEPDGSCIITDTFLTDGETQTHNFCSDTEDWIRFNGCAGTSFTIETSNLGSNCNTYLEIYDTDCSTLLASDDDSGTGLGSLINWVAPADGTYHIRVYSVGGSTGDNQEYDITLTGDTSPCSLWFVDYDEVVARNSPPDVVLVPTPDGGSIFLTYTGTLPQFDTRVLKLDSVGMIEWEKSYSIDSWDTSNAILPTSDGGYLFVGSSSGDLHVVKLNAAGDVSWHRVMGGSDSDEGYSVVEDPGNGYIIAGSTGSFGAGSGDAWVIKLNTGGAYVWQKAYGGTDGESARAIERESGGNLIFAGSTASFGAVNTDGWIVKTDSAGTILWDRRYGGSELDIFYSIKPTLDGGYIAAGLTGSSNSEGWIVKIDSSGTVQWERSYGSSYFDMFNSVIQTHEGGYIAAGTITIPATPQEYTWIVKMDASGNIEWQKRYTGLVDMRARSISQMPDEGYLIGTSRGMVLRIDSLGNTGAGCSYSTDTAITPSATTFGSVATTSATVNSTATVSVPAITTSASTTVIEDACPCPDASASIDTVLPSSSECAGIELTFSGSGSGLGSLTYEWDFDYDGITFDVEGSGPSVTHTYNPHSDTVYTVALRVSDSCTLGPATALDTTTVTVWKPALSITGPAGICRGDSALLDAGAGFSSYLWSPGGQTTQTISVSPYVDTTYSVEVTDSNGCIATGDHALAVWWNPVPTISEYGDCGDIILDAGAGYDTYLWSPGGETTQTLNIGTDTTTVYSVTVTNTYNCPGSDTHQASSICPGDPYEPDDSCADGASVLHGGDLQTHNFCDDAEDWFMFNASAGRSYTIETLNLCPSADTIIELYDTDCTTLLESDDNGGTGSASRLDWTSPGHGTYHIRVRNAGGSNGPDLGYDIKLTGDTSPYRLWTKTFDLTDVPRLNRIYWQEQTPDGGFIVAGETINRGTYYYDPWLFKLDALGNIEWEQRFIADISSATIHTIPAGGYYLTNTDGTVMKLDSTGSAVWQKQIDCWIISASLTEDDGLVIAGKVNYDFYAARLDAAGGITWQKTYGGGGDDEVSNISATHDGGFILAGFSGSFGTSLQHMWIIRLDGSGNIIWQRVYGADVGASAASIYPADDGGFIVGGYTWFSGGFYDPLIMKLTADGNIQWQRVFPDTSSQDSFNGVVQVSDSNYLALGYAGPSGGDSFFRLAKFDSAGSIIWQNSYSGDTGFLISYHLAEGIDGSLLTCGYTDSFGADHQAGFMFKTDTNGLVGSSCSIIASESLSYVDPLLESIVTSAVPANTNLTVADVAISSTPVTATVDEQCSTCMEAVALITDVSPSSTVCDGTEQTFTGNGFGEGSLTYQWDFDYDGITFDIMDTGTPVVYTYPSVGTFTAALRVLDSCGDPGQQMVIGTSDVTVNPNPSPVISGPSGICLGDPPVVLDAGAGYASYLWSPGGETTQTISVSPGTTTIYSVTVTFGTGCQGTDDHTLNVYPVPSPTITEYCHRGDIILDAGDRYETYLWSPGGQTTQTINIGSDTATSYSVTVTLTGGCEGTDNYTAAGSCTASGDIYEEDDTSFASDTVIDGGSTQSHDFLDDPEDWISFSACTDRIYTLETSNPGPLADTYLELYDTDGTTLLASDDNSGGDGVSSVINWTAPADGLYHIRVTQVGMVSGPDRSYDITLTGDTSTCTAWARSFGNTFWDSGYGAIESHDGGFMVAGVKQMGESEGDFWLFRLAGDGSTVWEKTYPGPYTDAAFALDRTSDGNYVTAGIYQQSGGGSYDFQAMEITDAGTIAWERRYGINTSKEEAYAVRETSDGGFIMAGKRYSIDSSDDGWILKLDASGNPSWGRQIGGSGSDYFNAVIETFDGGYLAAGVTNSYGDGAEDLFLVKLNSSGNKLWQKTYGGTSNDAAHAISETTDGGFLIAGETSSFGAGGKDFWVLRVDMAGTLLWQKTYGGTGDEVARSLTLTRDGGCAVAGETSSFGAGGKDFWVLKLLSTGAVSWQKTYGDTGEEGAISIRQNASGGFIIAGYTTSYGAGSRDFWVVKTRADGDIDSSCTFISDTAVTAQDSSDSWGYPSATVTYSLASSVTSTTPVDSSADTSEQCSYTACLPVSASIDNVSPSTTACLGEFLTFTGSGSGEGSVTLEWDFDYDGVTFDVMDTNSPVSYTYPATGTFTAALRVTDSCSHGAQEAIDTIVITIPDPSPVISGPASICEGESAQLDAGAGFASYLWSPGGMTTQSINVSPAVTTLYSVTVTDGDGCEGTDNHNLIVNPNPTPTITGPTLYCTGDPAITLDAGAGYSAYLWSPGSATSRTIDVTPASTTIYSVTVTDGNGCHGSDDHTVTVSAIPPIPQDFQVIAECGQIALSWTDDPNETLYRIERDAGSGFVLLTTLPADSSGYDDTGVSEGVSYSYRIRATNSCGDSAYSDTVQGATNTAVYGPTTITQSESYCNANVIYWNDTYVLEQGFLIQRQVDAGGTWEDLFFVPRNTGFYHDHDVLDGHTYQYRVKVRNYCGDSTPSNVVTLIPDCSVPYCDNPQMVVGNELISDTPTQYWSEHSALAYNGSAYGVVWFEYDMDTAFYFTQMYHDSPDWGQPNPATMVRIPEITDGQQPDIAWNGSLYGIVWSQNTDVGFGDQAHIMFAQLNPDGTLNDINNSGAADSGDILNISSAVDDNHVNPRIAWNGFNWGVFWEAQDMALLFRQVATDGTYPYGGHVALDWVVAPDGWDYSIGDLTSRNGSWYFVWHNQDTYGDWQLYFASMNDDQTDQTVLPLTSGTGSGPQHMFPRIAAGHDKLGIVYLDDNEAHMGSITTAGSWDAAPQKVSLTSICYNPDIESAGSEWAAVWHEEMNDCSGDAIHDLFIQSMMEDGTLIYDDDPGTPGFQPMNVSDNASTCDNYTDGRIAWGDGQWGIVYNEAAWGGNKNVVSAIITCEDKENLPPSAPANMTAIPFCNAVGLTWTDTSNNEDNFLIERSTNGGISYTLIKTLPANSYYYYDRTADPTWPGYFYRVRAVNNTMYSDYSTSDAVVALSCDASTFNDITDARFQRNPDGSISLSWSGMDLPEIVDTVRGVLGNFDMNGTSPVSCEDDSRTGQGTTDSGQMDTNSYFYVITVWMNDGSNYGPNRSGPNDPCNP